MITPKKPYVGQPLSVTHKTGLDLNTIGVTFELRGQKPSGAIVTKAATRVGTTDKIQATFSYTDINESGEWKFQSFVIYDVANTYPCRTQTQQVYELYH